MEMLLYIAILMFLGIFGLLLMKKWDSFRSENYFYDYGETYDSEKDTEETREK